MLAKIQSQRSRVGDDDVDGQIYSESQGTSVPLTFKEVVASPIGSMLLRLAWLTGSMLTKGLRGKHTENYVHTFSKV